MEQQSVTNLSSF